MKCFIYYAGEDGNGIVLADTIEEARELLEEDGVSHADLLEIDLTKKQACCIQ